MAGLSRKKSILGSGSLGQRVKLTLMASQVNGVGETGRSFLLCYISKLFCLLNHKAYNIYYWLGSDLQTSPRIEIKIVLEGVTVR